MIYCNDSLSRIALKEPSLKNTSFLEMNKLVANNMLNISSIQRFPGWQNMNMKKLSTNLIPFPRIHFMMSGISPNTVSKSNYHISSMLNSAFEYDSFGCEGHHPTSRYMTAASIFRGQISTG